MLPISVTKTLFLLSALTSAHAVSQCSYKCPTADTAGHNLGQQQHKPDNTLLSCRYLDSDLNVVSDCAFYLPSGQRRPGNAAACPKTVIPTCGGDYIPGTRCQSICFGAGPGNRDLVGQVRDAASDTVKCMYVYFRPENLHTCTYADSGGYLWETDEKSPSTICGFNIMRNCPEEPTALPDGWSVAHDCAVDDVSRSVLGEAVFLTIPDANTPSRCMSECAARGYAYAGVEHGSQCFCGSTLGSSIVEADASECHKACPGDSKASCGGSWRIQVYGKDA